MKKYFSSAGVALIMTAAFSFASMGLSAQCKSFVNQQINLLSPYICTGKANSTVLMPGDHSELALTFYSGQTYRIIMKSAESKGNVAFTIKDSEGKQLFKSNNEADYYDFTSETTQLLTLDMVALENTLPSEPGPSQCVVVVVGEKE